MKARNKFARKPANCVPRGHFFFFFNLSPREEDAYAVRIATCVHTWTLTGPVADTASSPSLIPWGREKKRKRDSGNARGKSCEGGCARESERDRDRFDEESERARAIPKPYTRRSKESSVLSATMVTKRTGRSLSLSFLLRSTRRSSRSPTDRAYVSFNRI